MINILVIFIIVIFLLLFLLFFMYNKNDQKQIKDLQDKGFQEKKIPLDKLQTFIMTVKSAYDIFTPYVDTMNLNSNMMFQEMDDFRIYEKYIKHSNKADMLLSNINTQNQELYNASNAPNINYTLVYNIIYDLQWDLKHLYEEINDMQNQLICLFRRTFKHSWIYNKYMINVLQILEIQVKSHLLIANSEYKCEIRRKYEKILDKISTGCIDCKLAGYIDELYSIFCKNYKKFYDKNIKILC